MAEELTNETTPKNITEDAVQELINLWKAMYSPDSTIEPTSAGVAMTKAVYNAIQTATMPITIPVTDNPTDGVDIEVTSYVKKNLLITGVIGIDVGFIPTSNMLADGAQWGIAGSQLWHLFANARYTLCLTNAPDNNTGWVNSGGTPLMTQCMISPLYNDIGSWTIAWFTRLACLYTKNNRYYIHLSPLMRGRIRSNVVTPPDLTDINVRDMVFLETPTENQKNACAIKQLILYR